ncbi:hypothetical protein NM688_g6488 [Phlebia brevispora]|uniref:Uncharacterized protein n=1 Tax=Phlebia brevispora TaxID=194682 RepID=A0ACC1SFL9_9APHY|nr:hypothetical protein NM688_g6488 [Phlebia brevispora]
MSQSQVATVEVVHDSHSSTPAGSLSIRAGYPPSPVLDNPAPKTREKAEDVELAVLSRLGNNSGSQTVPESITGTPPSMPVNAAKTARIQFATLCCALYLVGWNDGTTGPLLPRIQSNYQVGYAVVSLIYIFNCLGFVVAALAMVRLTDKFGFGAVMVIGSVTQAVGYSLESPAPPFPVFVLGYAINGFGIALQYLISLGLSVIVTVLHVIVFRFKTQEQCLRESEQLRESYASSAANEQNQRNKYRQIFRLKEVYFLACFILIYVGTAVTIGGWTVTYIIDVRHGGSSSGYVSSGFFGGMPT